MTHKSCSLGGRSYTSTVSNLVVLNEVHLGDDLFRIIDGRFDALRLLDLIDEFTHHACLSGSVGLALFHLHLLSQRAAWVMNDRKDCQSARNFFVLYARYHAAVLALRPISEGVALFAEFDIYPLAGKTEVVSIPGSFAALVGDRFYRDALDSDLLSIKLQMARHAALEKKADLLAAPFTSDGGGYLLGYTLVRSIWRRAAAHDRFFADPDTFLAYLQTVVSSDHGLASILLDVPQDQTEIRVYEIART